MGEFVKVMDSKAIFKKITDILPCRADKYKEVKKLIDELEKRGEVGNCSVCGKEEDLSALAIRQGICEECCKEVSV